MDDKVSALIEDFVADGCNGTAVGRANGRDTFSCLQLG